MFIGKLLSVATVGALIIGFVGGLSVGYIFPSVQVGGGLSNAQTEKLKNFLPIVSEMKTLLGTVKKIDGTTITLEIAESPNPFDEWPTARKVIVADTTKIIRISQKDPKEFQKELEAYVAIKLPSRPPPGSAKEETIKLSDIKSGDTITVEADHNIKSEIQFTATKITVSYESQQ